VSRKLTSREVELRCGDMVKRQTWKGSHAQYWFDCAIHGKYLQSYTHHQQGNGCPKCRFAKISKSLSLTVEQAESRCSDMVKGQRWEGNHAKYQFECEIHGRYLQGFSSHYSNGASCPKCSRERVAKYRSLTIEQAEARFVDMVKGQIWKGNAPQYWFNCDIHGRYLQGFGNHQQGAGCPECGEERRAKSRSLTIEQAERCFSDMVKGQTWKGNVAQYWFECEIHGKYLQSYTNHQQGKGCLKCAHAKISESRSLTIEQATKRCPEMVEGQKWMGSNAKYKFICGRHGNYWQTFGSHYRGNSCPKCGLERRSESRSLTIEQVKHRYPDIVKGQEWAGSDAKYWFACATHGRYLQNYNSHQQDTGCPKCVRSRGEEALEQVVRFIGITDYETQKRFLTCRNKNPLPFDGASESLRVLFEYHGVQHYQAIQQFGGQEQCEKTQEHDRIKRNWARRNGWRLIVIPYRIKNIEGYLRKRLGDFTVANDFKIAA
jgi:Zn finger protein HypA/HybF involved in hydrogenase expression